MASVYADLIKKGAINPKTGNAYQLDDVPAVIRSKVEVLLSEGGGENAG